MGFNSGFKGLRALYFTQNSYMKLIRNVITTVQSFKDTFSKVPLPSRYGRLIDSTINIALRAEINNNKIQFFFFVTLNKMVNMVLNMKMGNGKVRRIEN